MYREYNERYEEGLIYDFFLDAEDEENPTEDEIAEATEKADFILELLYGNYDTPQYDYNKVYRKFSPEIQRYTNSLWEELKIYGKSESWVHLTSGAIIVAILVWAVYSVIIKKYRSKDYRLRDKELKKAKSQKT